MVPHTHKFYNQVPTIINLLSFRRPSVNDLSKCFGSSRANTLPKGAEWIKQSVVSFDPDNSKLMTSEGDEISYEFLVVAMGLQLNYHEVRVL